MNVRRRPAPTPRLLKTAVQLVFVVEVDGHLQEFVTTAELTSDAWVALQPVAMAEEASAELARQLIDGGR